MPCLTLTLTLALTLTPPTNPILGRGPSKQIITCSAISILSSCPALPCHASVRLSRFPLRVHCPDTDPNPNQNSNSCQDP
ncbi:hypothetical protein BDW59DRAFT_147275 [Aspergillus cavernicola]|uniref:Secreted protein n=1 Tax=Aspergillus cavernicola TaxID=176166 RepID=A0ABR4IAC5_9EURO